MISKSKIEELKSSLKPLLDAEEKSRRLISVVPRKQLYIGICGVNLDFDSLYILDDFVLIRNVSNPPGIVHICRAANLKNCNYLGVGRYSSGIKAEIAVGYPNMKEDESFLLEIAFHIAALIKLRGYTTLFCPTASTCSWDVINCIKDQSIDFTILDDLPRQIKIPSNSMLVTEDDIDWVKLHWEQSLKLRSKDNSRRFGLSFNLMYTWNQTNDLRIALSNIWCGLEALFGKQKDKPVTKKLIERICMWLPIFDESTVRLLYDRRCDAVHGRWFNDEEIFKAIIDTEKILRMSIIKAIEMNKTPLPDWERAY